MWRHEQLALTMTTSDHDYLTASGEISDPSAALGKYDIDGDGVENLAIVGGHQPTFLIVSLPNGYRITGYKLVLLNNMAGLDIAPDVDLDTNHEGFHDLNNTGTGRLHFYETKKWPGGAVWSEETVAASEVIRTATASDGDNVIDIGNNSADNGKEYTIERTSQTADDMGNQLYFRLTKPSNCFFYGLTIKSFEIYFTAEGTFTANVKPGTVSTSPVSMTVSAFKTNKIDIGELKPQEKDGATYFAYDYKNVKDLDAYNYIYQEDAKAEVEEGEHEGRYVPADVAPIKKIYQLVNEGNSYFGLKNGIYYVETPVTVTNSSNNTAPIGYRIVGATINYAYGKEAKNQVITDPLFYIVYTYNQGQTNYTRYLDISGRFGTSQVMWEVDEDGYVHSGDVYLTYSSSGYNTRTLSIGNSSSNQKVKVDTSNRLYYTSTNSGNTYYLQGTNNASATPTFANSTNNAAQWTSAGSTHPLPDFVPEEYTIKVYDRTGKDVKKEITVSSGSDSYQFEELLNNDAIKFAIEGVDGSDGMALVTVDLQLQALDPYIDKMDIVCTDDRKVLSLTQSFTADDFSVSGGRFIFYVPEDYKNDWLTFTFSDLYSKYGDESYYDGGDGTSRYSFVTSDYFVPINGNGNGGLYDDAKYTPESDYMKKIYTSTAGNVRFKFNNAEDLDNSSTSTESKNLEEYPFSVYTYLHSTDPGDATATPPTVAGSKTPGFIDVKLKASSADQHSGTYYVFTADETRWNIAPTTAWQHRFYAFYRMEIDLRAKSFHPLLAWNKIYDKTCYDADGNGTDVEDSMWGVSMQAADKEEFDKGNIVIVPEGYLTYQEIIDNILGREGVKYTAEEAAAYNEANHLSESDTEYKTSDDWKITPITRQLDDTNTKAPQYMRQILYVDGTPLYAMLNSSENAVIKTLKDLKDSLAVNNLVFLPENTTSTLDNVAFKTSSGSLRAGKDIVLTDKKPFFSPYTINVDAANLATYTREVTVPENGQVTNATIMLPFTLKVESGLHTNPDGKCAFTVNTMNEGSEFNVQAGGGANYGTAFFSPLGIDDSRTEANKPYMVQVTKIDGSLTSNGKISFVAAQTGSDIIATPMDGTAGKKELVGEKNVSGKFGGTGGGTYYFTNVASFSGVKYDRAVSQDIFYFANNKYLNLHTLSRTKQYLYSYPFRGVYKYSTDIVASKQMHWFDIAYGENPFMGTPTDIDATDVQADLMVKAGKGFLTLSASRSQDVNIYTASGIDMKRVDLNAGETRTVALPAGLYILNGIKIIVK